jgi:ubiquinone/menaquinone biosynthesis C-methylase UbiE
MNTESFSMNKNVKNYWEIGPCGTDSFIVGKVEKYTKEWFEIIENNRYEVEPFIHQIAQFSRYQGKRVLEIGVGAGTDHLQWARVVKDLYGCDLTDEGINITRKRLETYGLNSNLQQHDAENLPFDDNFFDVVYSWGVIHHSESPHKIIDEIKRVLKTEGEFIGMLYQRNSLTTLRVWIKHALLKGRPWRSFSECVYHHVESIGTKAYTKAEILSLFSDFSEVKITPLLTEGDVHRLPKWIVSLLPNSLGWFLGIRAKLGPQK